MKRISVLLVTFCLAISCVACAGNQSETETTVVDAVENDEAAQSNETTQSQTQTQAAKSAPQNLSVVDSGYILTNGYIHYALELQNPNSDYLAQFAVISVVSRDADGKVVSSDDWTISSIYPSSTSYWASQAGDGSIPDDAQVEISVSVSSRDWIETNAKLPSDLYTFNGTSLTANDFGYLKGTGEITLNYEGELPMANVYNPQIVCILKTSDGKIITGFSDYMLTELSVGVPRAFEASSTFEGMDYSSYEFYANPW